jgi:hypothetical protein
LADQNGDQDRSSDCNSGLHHETPSPQRSLIGEDTGYDILG